ncbi:hypothetical protein K450DRAFT_249938 [Umbelopsis ramanniana AG]|uniref:Uncharacterized protein n=1 Tax=Umbelopsis ramanniana AG TaxID=1314678 RepID=A0AAD5E7V1_UMBRA|nr:uncharacterized protein K450DRAFT_249938 [Umbelopsis ramanniana AG]KAI8577931.1 hypothetical protein K450DRAFT_249938 [Umbelopsis ramanniana AG]
MQRPTEILACGLYSATCITRLNSASIPIAIFKSGILCVCSSHWCLAPLHPLERLNEESMVTMIKTGPEGPTGAQRSWYTNIQR